MPKEVDVNKYKEMYKLFLSKKNTAVISMKDDKGEPFSSCAPLS